MSEPRRGGGGGVVWGSLLVALFLSILPMPAWIDEFRPPGRP